MYQLLVARAETTDEIGILLYRLRQSRATTRAYYKGERAERGSRKAEVRYAQCCLSQPLRLRVSCEPRDSIDSAELLSGPCDLPLRKT